MKYIVTQRQDGKEEMFIFADTVNHDCMAEAISHMRNQTHGTWTRIDRTPVSAGFVEAGQCVGKSETLSLSSRPTDTQLLP